MQGKVVDSKPWFNLSMQSPQPLFGIAERVRVELVSGADNTAVRLSSLYAAVRPERAYEGGCSLQIKGETLPDCCIMCHAFGTAQLMFRLVTSFAVWHEVLLKRGQAQMPWRGLVWMQ